MGRYSELFQIQTDPFVEAPGDKKTGVAVRVCLFKEVKNAPEIRQLLHSGQLECSIIRAELVLEVFQILAAVNRAVNSLKRNKLATKSIHSEIVYSFSPTKNISDSLTTFGLCDESVNVVVIVVDDAKGDKMTKIAKKIQGRPVHLKQLDNVSDYNLVKQIYHVRDPELNKGTIMDAIVTRIVTKDYVA